METLKFYSILLKGRKETIQGILEQDGEEWMLLRCVFSDYIMDGWSIVNKRYIHSIVRQESEIFTEKVLRASNKWSSKKKRIPLLTDSLFDYLKNRHITFSFSLNDESVVFVGKIQRLLPKSFYLIPISPRGKWLDKLDFFKKESVRVIDVETDYINSLIAYNNKYEKQPATRKS